MVKSRGIEKHLHTEEMGLILERKLPELISVGGGEEIVKAFVQILREAAINQEVVHLHEYASIRPNIRPATKRYSFRAGQNVEVPAKRNIQFKSSVKFIEELNSTPVSKEEITHLNQVKSRDLRTRAGREKLLAEQKIVEKDVKNIKKKD